MEAKGFTTYMLKCDNCQSVFDGKDAFPEGLLCPRCLIVFKAGIKEVMRLDKDITGHILQDAEGNWAIESWRLQAWFNYRQAKLKEWGIDG